MKKRTLKYKQIRNFGFSIIILVICALGTMSYITMILIKKHNQFISSEIKELIHAVKIEKLFEKTEDNLHSMFNNNQIKIISIVSDIDKIIHISESISKLIALEEDDDDSEFEFIVFQNVIKHANIFKKIFGEYIQVSLTKNTKDTDILKQKIFQELNSALKALNNYVEDIYQDTIKSQGKMEKLVNI
ncbi:secreted protein, partial [Candidatus Magnetomorum sp. HK-1]